MNIHYESGMRRLVISLAMIAALSLCGCVQETGYGTLEGRISIGPLCPVEKNPPDPSCQPTAETYAAWPISVYKDNTVVGQLHPIPPDGSYTLELPAGDYMLDLKDHQGIGSDNLPLEITIYSGEITTLDIGIDTGMR